MPIIIKGIIASPGIKIGKAFIYRGTNVIIPKYIINENQIEKEISRFSRALEKTKKEIMEIQSQIADNLSKDLGDIFLSHIMVLEDPLIEQNAIDIVRKEKRNIEWVLNDISLDLISNLNSINDDYLRERIIDISDINKRLISNLQDTEIKTLRNIKNRVIVFSSDLTPSDTAMMNKKYVLAFVTDKGGNTTHSAIMARALEIPAIVGCINGTSMVKEGDTVIVDAIYGKIIINPSEKDIKEYTRHQEDLRLQEIDYAKLTHLPAVTMDNEEITILGNIELPEEKELIHKHGAQGIGLLRSEFLFLDKSLPDEDRQFIEYKNVIEYFNPLNVTIRTLDVGGDKIYSFTKEYNDYNEQNPSLGCRAIRFSLQNIDILITQLRAILRASHYGNVKLMFPMISTVEEIIKVREILSEIMDNLKNKGIPFDENIPVGIMIEVPSAAINADILSMYVDFFSVGTNDLVQYTLAVDRLNENIAYLYNACNLSILRLLKNVISVSIKNSIPLSICGEIAGEPKFTMLLLGLGFRNLSMSSAFINQIKRIIRSVTITECEALVSELLQIGKTEEIESKLFSIFKEKFPMMVI